MKYDLSILIPSRNEIFLAQTVSNILENIEGNTEIIVVLDGAWADPPLPDDPRLTILYHNESVGQRKATNEACRLSKSKWVMKIDAHCAVDKGFDVKMMKEMEGHDDWTMIPALYNLHAFDWKCRKCGNIWYQSPTPNHCKNNGESKGDNPNCDSMAFEQVMIWKPRESRRSEHYRFDTTLHFQYHGARKKHPENQGKDIVETMSAQGSCFMLTREKYWELNICDEDFGSWGQQGTEVACKTWLSGGKLVTNKKTWYSHMFRTQGGDFGFPYPISGKQTEHAREYSRELFLNNTWKGQVKPLLWLIEKFAPLPDWHDPQGKEVLDLVVKKGLEFDNKHKEMKSPDPITQKNPKKEIIYYTYDSAKSPKMLEACREQLRLAEWPIIYMSNSPIENVERNASMKNLIPSFNKFYLSFHGMFKKILLGLELSTADYCFMAEDDVMYDPSHFDFTPPTNDMFYYNENVWHLRLTDGFAISYTARRLSQMCGNRKFLIEHFRNRLNKIEKIIEKGERIHWQGMGFEPGTHNRADRIDDFKSGSWMSKVPSIDLKDANNATTARWKPSEFRDQRNCKNWKEANWDTIPDWNRESFNFK